MTESPWKVNVDDENDHDDDADDNFQMFLFLCPYSKEIQYQKSPQFPYNDQEDEGAFAPELGTGVGQLGLQAKGEKGGQVKTYI